MKKIVDANSDGGTLLGVMTEQECAQQCFDRYPDCLAVDFRTSDRICYTHSVAVGTQWNDCCNRYQFHCDARTYGSFMDSQAFVALKKENVLRLFCRTLREEVVFISVTELQVNSEISEMHK